MTPLRFRQTDPVGEAQRLFTEAAVLAGRGLTARANQRGASVVGESRDLQPEFKAALETVTATARPRPTVSPSLAHGLKPLWPRLGNFDISLSWGPKATVYGELKCDSTLTACAWDAAKCAFALRHGVGVGMLLVAAAAQSVWDRRELGTELFADGEWVMSDLRDLHEIAFRGYETEARGPYRPVRVPHAIRTTAVSRTAFAIAEQPWSLAIARVEPLGEDWFDWPPFAPDRVSP